MPATTPRFAPSATTARRTQWTWRRLPHDGSAAPSQRRRPRRAIDILGLGMPSSPLHGPIAAKRGAPAHHCRHPHPTPTTRPTATARPRRSTTLATVSSRVRHRSRSTRDDGMTEFIRWGHARAHRQTTIDARGLSSLATTDGSGGRGCPPCWNIAGLTIGTSSARAAGDAPTRLDRAARHRHRRHAHVHGRRHSRMVGPPDQPNHQRRAVIHHHH